MLTTQVLANTNIVEAHLDGAVETEEVEALRADLDRIIAEHGKAKMLFFFDDVGNVEPQAIWEDMKLEARALEDVERVAVVTDKGWYEKMVDGLDPLVNVEMEHFEPGEQERALRWLTN